MHIHDLEPDAHHASLWVPCPAFLPDSSFLLSVHPGREQAMSHTQVPILGAKRLCPAQPQLVVGTFSHVSERMNE